MNLIQVRKSLASVQVISGVLLIIWWMLMGIALPVSQAQESLSSLVLHENWVAVNVIGLIGCVLCALSLPVFCIFGPAEKAWSGISGLLIAETGLILFSSIQYYETFLWPAAAARNPELLEIQGALVFGEPLVMIPLLISGILLGLGYIVLSVNLMKKKTLPRILPFLLLFGAPIFGNGVIVPVRTIGLLMLTLAMIWGGIHIYRERSS